MDITQLADDNPEDARWRRWQLKGRADDARFRRRLRSVVVNVAGVAAVAGALWLAFWAVP